MAGIPDDNGPVYVSPNQRHYEHRLDVLLKQRFGAIADRALAEGRELMELLAEARAERDAAMSRIRAVEALCLWRDANAPFGANPITTAEVLRALKGDA